MSNNFIDLKQFAEETLDLKMPDGKIVHVNKPTEKMYIDFVKFQNLGTAGKSDEEVMQIFNKMILSILNHNSDGTRFRIETVEKLLFPARMAIMKAYTEFILKLTTQKNF